MSAVPETAEAETAEPETAAPLRGVTVLDLSQFLAGPNATQILADMGARVIKVEPKQGDSARSIPPYYVDDISAYFVSTNRSKQSIVLDLKSAAGRDVFLDMVGQADVVIENFRPGVVDRLGIGYEAVRGRNPGIVYCSITGFGSTGPMADRPAYDIIVQALSGVMGINGEQGRPPARLSTPVGDLAAGMFAAIGILSALHERTRTGRGARLEVSMLQTLRSMLSYLGQYYLTDGVVAGPQGGGHLSIPTYRSFRCLDDRWIVIAANTEPMWARLCIALEVPELSSDPRFLTNAIRLQNQTALHTLLDERFLKRESAEWLTILHRHDIPAGGIKSIDEVLTEARDEPVPGVVDVRIDATGEDVPLLASPITFAGSSIGYDFAPHLGEHTAAVLRELAGASDRDIADLTAAGVIVTGGRER